MSRAAGIPDCVELFSTLSQGPDSGRRSALSVAAKAALVVLALAVAAVAYATSPGPEKSYRGIFEPGVYACAGCGAELFASGDKFRSNTRWPSFRDAVDGAVATRLDTSLELERTEVVCARCGLHLGHRFDDGVLSGDRHPDAKWRFCVLSESLEFRPCAPPAATSAAP